MYKGQKVKRIHGGDDAFPAVNSYTFVKEVYGDGTKITLEGCSDYLYDALDFQGCTKIITQEELAMQVVDALHVIDAWNKTCPTGLLISVDGYPAVDGGSVFEVGKAFDTNSPCELLDKLIEECNKEALSKQLEALNKLAGKLK